MTLTQHIYETASAARIIQT